MKQFLMDTVLVHPGISFQFRLPYLLTYYKMFTSMNFLVLSYLIVSRKPIQHDAMNTNVEYHLGIIKQFLQHFFIPMKSEIINCLIKILSEVRKTQKLYFSGNSRSSREYLHRQTKFLAQNLGIANSSQRLWNFKSSSKVP